MRFFIDFPPYVLCLKYLYKARLAAGQILSAVQLLPAVPAQPHLCAPRAGIDKRFPRMPQGALPPDAAVASGRYHLRRQVSVEGRVPLRRHIRRFCGKIVEPFLHHFPATDGTACS